MNKKVNPKNTSISFRVDAVESAMLRELCEKMGISQGEIIRKGLQKALEEFDNIPLDNEPKAENSQISFTDVGNCTNKHKRKNNGRKDSQFGQDIYCKKSFCTN